MPCEICGKVEFMLNFDIKGIKFKSLCRVCFEKLINLMKNCQNCRFGKYYGCIKENASEYEKYRTCIVENYKYWQLKEE